MQATKKDKEIWIPTESETHQSGIESEEIVSSDGELEVATNEGFVESKESGRVGRVFFRTEESEDSSSDSKSSSGSGSWGDGGVVAVWLILPIIQHHTYYRSPVCSRPTRSRDCMCYNNELDVIYTKPVNMHIQWFWNRVLTKNEYDFLQWWWLIIPLQKSWRSTISKSYWPKRI
jgi:hypothetical protein